MVPNAALVGVETGYHTIGRLDPRYKLIECDTESEGVTQQQQCFRPLLQKVFDDLVMTFLETWGYLQLR